MDEQARQQEANFRYGLIASLVSRKLDPGEQMALMREIVSHEYETPSGNADNLMLQDHQHFLFSLQISQMSKLHVRIINACNRKTDF